MKYSTLMKLISSVLFTGVLIAASSAETSVKDLQMAPVNPDFTAYQAIEKTGKVQTYTKDWNALGEMPNPIDKSYLKNFILPPSKNAEAKSLPVSFDLRTTDKLPAVRNQANCGSCWTFGSLASLESGMLPGEVWDFSENNMKNTHGFLSSPCAGGNDNKASAYLLRWSGPILEADDPYNDIDVSDSPAGLSPRKHVQNIYELTGDFTELKQAIMSHGVVKVSMFWDDAAYNSTNKSFYYQNPTSTNHAVSVVGWDDNYSASNFNVTAPGNGAWIIRNNWSSAWGDGGYFYISYYDAVAPASPTIYAPAQSTTVYHHVYQYDPFGHITDIGYSRITAWVGNIFTAQSNEYLAAVGTYFATPGSSYDVYVYSNVTSAIGPRTGSLVYQNTGTVTNAGYSTISLNTVLFLPSAQKFSVVMRLITPGYNYPIPLEYPVSGYCTTDAAAGQSWISSGGSSWQDITSLGGNYALTNICVKAYTVSCGSTQQVQVSAKEPVTFHLMTYSPSTVYTPLTVNVNAVTGTDTLTVTAFDQKHPNAVSGYYASRWFRIQSTGGITDANLTLNFTDQDLSDSSISEDGLLFAKYSGGSWYYTSPSSKNLTTNLFTLNNVTSFSDWTLSGPDGVPVDVSEFQVEDSIQ